VTIIQTGANNYGVSYKLDNNIKMVNIHAKSKIKPLRYMQEIRQLVSYLNKHPNATVISFIVASIFNCGVASLFVKNKIVVSERNNPKECPAGRIRQKMRDWAFSRADVCVFQTEEAMKMFPKSVQRKGVIIPNPINGNLPIPDTDVREKRIVAACRLHPQKNLPMLIKAFYYLQRDYPDYVLEIYGQGDERERLENMVRELNLEQSVLLPGFADDIHDKMLKAAMYVSSSNYEGISNSMLEAMGMGVPTVVTDCPVGGSRMMIKNGINGLLVPVGDAKAMYTAMKKVISDTDFSAKLSSEAIKVNDQYPLEKVSRRWLDLF
jgi:glycosyltransferase involved in cell wall biosynthesis